MDYVPKKCFKRREWMDCLGYGRSSHEKDLRICPNHPMELVKGKSVCVEIDGHERLSVPVEPFEAPVLAGSKSFAMPATTSSNGMGIDREILSHVLRISSLEANLSTVTQIAIAKVGLVQVHNVDKNTPPNQLPAGDGKVEDLEPWQMPCIMFETLVPGDVKRRTGFQDLKHLLC